MADKHTIAKISIVGKYLYRWALITGTTFAGEYLTYIDGFAGPGEYTNHPNGSPIEALNALNQAKVDGGVRWKAKGIRALFIEQDRARREHLERSIDMRNAAGDVKYLVRQLSFEAGIEFADTALRKAFYTSAPLVVFVDPFGATGFPWETVLRILSSNTSGVILNFDADGMARIVRAGSSANADEVLDTIFGDQSWKPVVSNLSNSRDIAVALLSLYRRKLRTIPGVKYTFTFEMASNTSGIDYFLLFASRHELGLIKMKEAMKEIDGSGQFRFSDAEAQQGKLFRFDYPQDWVDLLCSRFGGETVSFAEVNEFVLNETPLISPSRLLYAAQELGKLEVGKETNRARKNIFTADTVKEIIFRSAENA